MTELRIPMSDELVDAIGALPIVDLYDLHCAAAAAAKALNDVACYPRCGAGLEDILDEVSDFLHRIADNAATFAPEVETTTEEERDRKAELMLRHLFRTAAPGLLSASAAVVAAGLTCGHVDREFFCAGGWQRANDDAAGEVRP